MKKIIQSFALIVLPSVLTFGQATDIPAPPSHPPAPPPHIEYLFRIANKPIPTVALEMGNQMSCIGYFIPDEIVGFSGTITQEKNTGMD
jgi:hypothetical protein